MAGTIKGITIEFRGETTKLDKALRDIRDNTKSLDKELKGVDNALKFNPTNVDLWRQKQELLTQKVDETKTKLDVLKQAQAQMNAEAVDKNTSEYRELERQLIITENQVKNFEGQLRAIGNVKLKALSEEFAQIGTKLEGAGQSLSGISTAAAGVVAGLGAISVKAGIAADDLNTMSKVTGIGTENLQKYGYAADLVDVSVEAIAKSNKRLIKNAYEAANGGKSQAEAFAAIGVSVTDANGELRNSEAIFQDVIAGLGKMTNETERDAIAQTLMGKSAAELNPLIEDGGKTYKMVAETMKKYNLDYVDQATLDKANQFNDSIDTMKLLGSVAFAQVGSQLAAYLAPALEKVVDLVGKFANWLSTLSPETLTVIATIAGLIAVLAPVLTTLGKLATGIGAIINLIGIVGPAIGALSSGALLPIIGVVAAVVAAGVLLYKNWDKIKEVASAVGAKVQEIWTKMKEGVSARMEQLKNKVTSVWTSIKTAVSNVARTIFDAMTWPFRSAWETIKNVVNTIKSFFPINLGNLFKGIEVPHFAIEWSSIQFGDYTIDYPSGFDVEWYKKGGIFSSPSVIGVAEAGSEAVVPLDKFWDKLDNIAAASGAPTINIYPGPNQSAREIAKEVEWILVQQQKQKASAYGTI